MTEELISRSASCRSVTACSSGRPGGGVNWSVMERRRPTWLICGGLFTCRTSAIVWRGTAYPVKVGSSIIFGDKNLASYKVSEEPDEDGPADPAPSGTIKVDGEDAKKDDEPDYSW